MPGDWWQQFANLRLLFGYMWAHPGKKLLFMGGEFGQRREWNHDAGLDWWICEYPEHAGVQRWVGDLNRVYRAEPALHELDFARAGFEWVDGRDIEASVVSFLRISASGDAGARRSPTSRRSCASSIASACRAPAGGASCSTATPAFTAAAASATWAARRRRRWRRMAGRFRSR